MTSKSEILANKMATLKKDLSDKVGVVDSSPVTGIKHSGLAMWYALKVGFDSPIHDPNKLAKLLVIKYERGHRDTLFFKNGNERKIRDMHKLSEKISTFIQ